MLSEKEGSEGLSAGSVGTLPRVTLGPVRELESLLICLLMDLRAQYILIK